MFQSIISKLMVAALLPCIACQRYVPVEFAPPPVGSDVRVSLSDAAAGTSFARIGSRIRQAEGRLLTATDSTLAIGVTGVMRTNGLEDGWNGDTVVFRRSEVLGVEKRQISRSRTWLSVGAFVLGGIVAHAGLQGGDRSGSGQPRPGDGH